ncbi:metal ABC transporter substrate-binding protein [Elusimicrobiota bacterium]
MKHKLLSLILFFIMFCSAELFSAEKLKIIATTTHIGSIAKEIGKERVEVVTIIPANMCPGHFDLSPKIAKKIFGADLLINHLWDKEIQNVIDNSGAENIKRRTITISDSWMVPENNIRAAGQILGIISLTDKKNSDYYKNNYLLYRKAINEKAEEILRKNYHLKYKNVIVSVRQKDFMDWLGMNVVDIFHSGDNTSIQGFVSIMRKASTKKIDVVVDNRQSKTRIGKQIARDLNAQYIDLTNFPVNNLYLETLENNVNELNRILR